MKRLVACFTLMLAIGSLSAQQNPIFFTGFFPEISLTKKVNDQIKLNFKVENQEIIFNNQDTENQNPQFTHYRTDIMILADRSIRPGISVSLGVFHRFQENEDGNRIIQQLAILRRMRNLRLNHRFRTDQTFTKKDDLEVRFRYRFSMEIPLEGDEVDPSEFYMVLSEEPIFSYKGGDFEIENRTAIALGKLFNSQEKLEWALDYRTDGYIQEGFRTRLWIKFSYYYNF